MSSSTADKYIANINDADEPLKGDSSSGKNQNDDLIISQGEQQQSSSWMLLFHVLRKTMWGALYYSSTGMVGAFLVGGGGFLVRTTLYMEAIFLLGPLGAANGLLQACREIVIESGLAASVGRQVYERALALVQDEEQSSRNLKEALEDLRRSYPLTDSILTGGQGGGILGSIAHTCMSLVLPMNVSNILDQIEAAVDWAEEHEEKLEDTEIIARATTEYLDDYIQGKQELVTRVGLLSYAGIAGVSLALSFVFQTLTGTSKKNG